MTAKSTINTKLPKVSKIAFYSNISKGTSFTKGFTDEAGKFAVTVGMRQPSSKAYGYQVQKRHHYRYTATRSKKVGANWSAWTAWTAAAGSRGTADPNTWLASNIGAGTADYIKIFTYPGNLIDTSQYDAMCVQFRARTYDAKNRKHGDWVTADLYVYCRAEVVDEILVASGSGTVDVDYNYRWDRGGVKLHLDSIKEGTRELLLKKFDAAPQKDSARGANTDCPRRSGYEPGTSKLEVGTYLKAMPTIGASLAVSGYLLTADGAQTALRTPMTLLSGDADLQPPRVTITEDAASGNLTVRAYKTDADDDLNSVGISISYVYNGKKYTVNPTSSTKNINAMSTTTPVMAATFASIPLNTQLSVKATFGNRYKRTSSTSQSYEVSTSRFSYVVSEADPSIAAHALGDLGIAFSSKYEMESELPLDAGRPFVVLGKGRDTSVSMAFKIGAVTGGVDQHSGFESWASVMGNPGIYVVKLHDGRMYRIAFGSMSIGAAADRAHRVSMSGVEV